jgi:hypothetical protein
MNTRISFHAFTFEGEVYSGKVGQVQYTDGRVEFPYEYDHGGIRVTGTFEGQQGNAGSIDGRWSESSLRPIEGKRSWTGEAFLKTVADDGRVVLFGQWTMKGVSDERWLIEVEP